MSPTPEAGGSTTHAGINFQNCIAVLRLAHMLSDIKLGESSWGRVLAVRSEAPAEVDDVVVTYSSNRKEYIQAKLNISPSDNAWNVMWQHFYKQYRHPEFNQGDHGDIITLASSWSKQAIALESLVARAATSESSSIWKERLTQPHLALLSRIMDVLNIDDKEALDFFRHLKVWPVPYELDPLKSNSFEHEVRRIVKGTVSVR